MDFLEWLDKFFKSPNVEIYEDRQRGITVLRVGEFKINKEPKQVKYNQDEIEFDN